jgi:hypothetical protein
LAIELILLALVLMISAACQRAPETRESDESRPPVIAEASVDRAVATTGDLITYTVTVDYRPGYRVEIPEPGAEIAGFRIVEVGEEGPTEAGRRIVESRWYQLRADLVGSYVLPPVTVTYSAPEDAPVPDPAAAGDEGSEDGSEGESEASAIEAAGTETSTVETVQTSAIFVEVASVLPTEGGADDIRDIKPLQPPPEAVPWHWIALAAGALLLAALAWWWWRRRSRRPAAPPAPPHEVAFEALDRLRGTDFEDPEAVRRFHFAISEVVRVYIEGRWGLNATDLTSEEIIAHLSQLSGLAGEQAVSLRRFLLDTDQVKFADHEPSREEVHQTYERALGFVEATRPVAEAEGAGREKDGETEEQAA